MHQPLILPTLRLMLIWSCRYTQFANQYLDCSIDIVVLAAVHYQRPALQRRLSFEFLEDCYRPPNEALHSGALTSWDPFVSTLESPFDQDGFTLADVDDHIW